MQHVVQLSPLFSDAATIFYAILIEALPFIVLGVIISSFLSVFVKDAWLLKLIPKNRLFGHITIACFGFLFPVCECGNIPVARRLIAKGVPTSQAITFLLAAPVFNPIVILATYTAFGSIAPELVVLRVVVSFAIALIVGLILSLIKDQRSLLTSQFLVLCETKEHTAQSLKAKLYAVLHLMTSEVLQVFGALLVGSFIAALISSFPRETIFSYVNSPLSAIIAMMILAFVMTICSTVDAFVALGYATLFPMSAILAFLVFGPMIDIRSLSMMSTTVKPKVLIMVTAIVTQLVLIASIGYSLFGS